MFEHLLQRRRRQGRSGQRSDGGARRRQRHLFFNGRQFIMEAKTDERCQIFYQELVYRPVRPLQSPEAEEEDNDANEVSGGCDSDCFDNGEG